MLIHDWLARAFFTRTFPPPGVAENNYKVEANVLKDILAFVDQHPQGKLFDRNLLLLILANQAFGDRNSEEGYSYFKRIDPKSLEGSSNRYEYIEKIFFLNMMKQLATNLASSGYGQDAINMAEQFVNKEERVYAYLFMTESVYQQDASPDAFIYLDSAFSYANRIDFTSLNFGLDSRYNMILLLSRMGGSEINSKAVEILREIPEQGKFDAILARVVGVAYEGNYFQARMSIPNTLTESQDLDCRTQILREACKKRDQLINDTRWESMDRFDAWFWYYINYLSI
jgi:hypothetical protein